MCGMTTLKVSYLEMIQRNIERMASESARMKSFALLSTAAILSTSTATASATLALAGIVLIVVFWLLDAQYLAQERWFRDLYERALASSEAPDFMMVPDESIRIKNGLMHTLSQWSVTPLYAALALVCLGGALSVS